MSQTIQYSRREFLKSALASGVVAGGLISRVEAFAESNEKPKPLTEKETQKRVQDCLKDISHAVIKDNGLSAWRDFADMNYRLPKGAYFINNRQMVIPTISEIKIEINRKLKRTFSINLDSYLTDRKECYLDPYCEDRCMFKIDQYIINHDSILTDVAINKNSVETSASVILVDKKTSKSQEYRAAAKFIPLKIPEMHEFISEMINGEEKQEAPSLDRLLERLRSKIPDIPGFKGICRPTMDESIFEITLIDPSSFPFYICKKDRLDGFNLIDDKGFRYQVRFKLNYSKK